MKTKTYIINKNKYFDLINDTENWLIEQKFKTQKFDSNINETIIQAKEKNTIKKITGMASAVNIVFSINEDTVTIKIGKGKWLNKVGIGAIGFFVAPPLVLTTAIGAFLQLGLADKIFDKITQNIIERKYN
ncbi:MAG: hypothetical protein GX951_03120 [Mollicutes bacterium]|nr:hypothetical protein [Mollicutes bacterium]